jgi:hypothetical protein
MSLLGAAPHGAHRSSAYQPTGEIVDIDEHGRVASVRIQHVKSKQTQPLRTARGAPPHPQFSATLGPPCTRRQHGTSAAPSTWAIRCSRGRSAAAVKASNSARGSSSRSLDTVCECTSVGGRSAAASPTDASARGRCQRTACMRGRTGRAEGRWQREARTQGDGAINDVDLEDHAGVRQQLLHHHVGRRSTFGHRRPHVCTPRHHQHRVRPRAATRRALLTNWSRPGRGTPPPMVSAGRPMCAHDALAHTVG